MTLKDRLDRLFQAFSDAALANAAPAPGEYVIEIGCGCGGTTLDLARAAGPAGNCTVWISPVRCWRTLPNARRPRGWGTSNSPSATRRSTRLRRPDVFPARCDVLRRSVSRLRQPPSVLEAGRADGSRGAAHRADNRYLGVAVQAARPLLPPDAIGSTTPNQPGMFSLADPERVRSILTEAGFHDVVLSPLDLSIQMGDTPSAAAEFSAQFGPVATALENATIGLRERVVAAIAKTYADIERPDGVLLAGAFWILSARVAMD